MSCHLSYSEGGGKGVRFLLPSASGSWRNVAEAESPKLQCGFFFFTPLFFLPPSPSPDSVIYDGRALEHPLQNDEGGNMILIIMK